ncbi:hypothetical protein ACIP93_19535 [Streptomyces sp. NPDC088745]|uniref:hypothetical protein n=1 Tax=Streptomyces sp. NPDC088745 TaxID=3365884 RepID=UPI0037F4E455
MDLDIAPKGSGVVGSESIPYQPSKKKHTELRMLSAVDACTAQTGQEHGDARCGKHAAMRSDQRHWFLGKGTTPKQLKAYAWVFAVFAILELATFLITATGEDPNTWTLILTGLGSILFPTMLLLTLHYLRDMKGPKT